MHVTPASIGAYYVVRPARVGFLFSVAPDYEQNGDVVPDRDVVFVHAADSWIPTSFQDSIAYGQPPLALVLDP